MMARYSTSHLVSVCLSTSVSVSVSVSVLIAFFVVVSVLVSLLSKYFSTLYCNSCSSVFSSLHPSNFHFFHIYFCFYSYSCSCSYSDSLIFFSIFLPRWMLMRSPTLCWEMPLSLKLIILVRHQLNCSTNLIRRKR